MNRITTSLAATFANPRVALAARILLVMVGALVLTLISNPQLAFADGGNPFADTGARSVATDVLKSLRFWVWIAAGIGFSTYLLAYFAQGIVPSFFQQYRDYLRNGALLMVAFGIVVEFIIKQANAA